MEIILKSISKQYSGKNLFNKIDLVIPEYSIITITGKNASGKSTLLKIVAGLVKQDSGDVLYKKDDEFIKYELAKKRLGYGGNYELLIETLTGYQYLKFISLIYKLSKEKFSENLNYLTKLFNPDQEILLHKISTLSSGYKRLLELFSVFIHNPEVIILDEPFKSLDNIFIDSLINYLILQKEHGRTLLVATHYNKFIDSFSDKSFKL